MKKCRIFIYKLQHRRFKFLNIISNITGIKDFRHNKYYSTGQYNKEDYVYMITVHEKSIDIFFYGEVDFADIAYDFKNKLVNKINAEKIYFEFDGNEEWVTLENFRPKIINRIRYKLLDILKD